MGFFWGDGGIPLTRHHLAISAFPDAQTVRPYYRMFCNILPTLGIYGGESVVGEEGGFDYYAYAELGVEFVVVEEAFAVAVVVLEEEVLVLVVA